MSVPPRIVEDVSKGRSASFADANVSELTPRLLVGGDIDLYVADVAVRQLAELVMAGLTHVVDCRLELDDAELWGQFSGIDYFWHPVDDAGQVIPAEWFDLGVEHILAALDQPDSLVLVHCHMGINRGPSLAYAALLALGADPVEAIDLIRTCRPVANVWYAEDALRWWQIRAGLDQDESADQALRLARWREEHPLDVVRVIAEARGRELGIPR